MKTRLAAALAVIGLLSAAIPASVAAASMYPTSGPMTGGTLVTITGGSGFSIATTVQICSKTAAPTTISVDGTSLTFMTPSCPTAGLTPVTTQTPQTIGLPGFYYTTVVPGPVTLVPSNGPKGTMVTMNAPGQGPFTSSTTVTVGGVAAPQVFPLTQTSLLFEVPDAGAAGSKAVVTASPATVGVPTFGYTIPGVSMSPTSGPTTGGTVVMLTGTAGSFDYYCQVAGFVGVTLSPTSVSVDGARMTFVTPAGTGTVAVAIAAAAGAPSSACKARGLSAGTFTFTGTGQPPGGTPSITPTSGPAGTVISVLNATGFTTATMVFICGTSVFPTSIAASGTSLTFVAPACSATTAQIVSTSNPTYSNVGSFTYGGTAPQPPSPPGPTVPTAPIVTSVSPNSGPVAGGNSVTVTGAYFQPGARVVFGTVQSAAVTFVSTGSLTAIVPAGTGVVTVAVQNPDGYSGGLAGAYTYTGAAGYTCVAGTALGVAPMNATYSLSTKVVKPNEYVTYRFSCTNAAAGALITVLGAQKNSAGVWSAFTPYTKRYADASGNALVYVRMASPSWWSFRAQISNIYSNAVQARWKG
jgi:hypothetical protein